ncbi:MAG: universal stress protein [Halanaeroarchaeum sp.]
MRKVLMPVDEDTERLQRQLATVDRVFDASDVEITVLYVHETVDTPGDEAGEEVIDMVNENIEELQGLPDTIERAANELGDAGIDVEVMERVGEAVPSILKAGENLDADPILISSRDQTPVGKVVFGSVTQGVILDSDRPVLVAK